MLTDELRAFQAFVLAHASNELGRQCVEAVHIVDRTTMKQRVVNIELDAHEQFRAAVHPRQHSVTVCAGCAIVKRKGRQHNVQLNVVVRLCKCHKRRRVRFNHSVWQNRQHAFTQ